MSNLWSLLPLDSFEAIGGRLLPCLLHKVLHLVGPRNEHLPRPCVLLMAGRLGSRAISEAVGIWVPVEVFYEAFHLIRTWDRSFLMSRIAETTHET